MSIGSAVTLKNPPEAAGLAAACFAKLGCPFLFILLLPRLPLPGPHP